jgi:Fuc2NAc and GlcNAc transferase
MKSHLVELVVLATFLISMALTRYMIAYAGRTGLLDVPGARSSHTKPTPRGGGLAIVAAFWLGGAMMLVPVPHLAPWLLVLLPSLAVAAIGWRDDRRSVSAKVRLGIHLISALVFLIFASNYGPLGLAWASLAIAWSLNLFNFMDGIDGIAAGEGATLAASSALLCMLHHHGGPAAIYLLLAAACAGFLVFNRPPARIFMGDVASGFLGFLVAAAALISSWLEALPLSASVLLYLVFAVDATYTLTRRALARKPLMNAHRDHAYQHAARRWGHGRVTMSVCAINLFWLLPLAVISVRFPDWRWAIVAVGALPLIGAEVALQAGVSLQHQ